MAWITSYLVTNAYWGYNANVSVLGIQRRNTGTLLAASASNGTLRYALTASHTFKSNKMYQFELEVKGDFTTMGLSASYNWSSNSIFSDARIDRVVSVDAAAGARYFFYSSPSSNTSTVYSISIFATGSMCGNSSTSPRITNIKVNELDWKISGYKRFSPGTTASLNDVNYDGWSYEKSINTFWWTNKPVPTMGATGLSTNNDISTNYISKSVIYSYYNLNFEYITSGGSASDGFSIYQGDSYAGAIGAGALYTLTQSQFSTQSTPHQIYGLQGNGQFLYIVGGTTSDVSGFVAGIINPTIEGGYHPNNNEQFLFTESDVYSDPTYLQILGTATDGMTFSFIVGSGSTINGTPSNLNLINAQFGNGTFRAGVWENGVWNSGWRVDTQIYEFDNVGVAFRTIADRRWRIQLTGPTSSAGQFEIGDRISISNIVAIDINETRKLLKGYFTIINKSDSSIIVETDVSFPFRRIEKDSDNHKIKVTKNVWLSGAFLNGYYTGIWNYGLFKGFPRITEMVDTHWIDGIFDGGHFNSTYESYVFDDTYYITGSDFGIDSTFDGKLGLSFSTPHGYVVGDVISIDKFDKSINPNYDGNANVTYVVDDNLLVLDKAFANSSVLEGGTSSNTRATGLIQNFRFYDNNIAGKVSSQNTGSSEEVFQFNSWIDVNYYNTSAVNIGKPVRLYDTTAKLEYTQNNLYGYPTNDVLSSISTFRDSYTFNKKNYKLGTKYKIYQDQIGIGSEFESPFDMNGDTGIGLNTFLSFGWTFSGTYSKFERSIEDPTYNSGVSDEYQIKGEELIITSTMSGSILNNTNIDISNNRYTVVELDIKSYSTGTSSTYYQASEYSETTATGITYIDPVSNLHPIPVLNFSNINQFRNTISFDLGVFGIVTYVYYPVMSYLPIYENVNHLETPGIKKYEYFYNKPSLSMKLLGNDDLGTSFDDISDNSTTDGYYQSKVVMDNLKYYEVDMIPFFQYFLDDNIYKGVSIPWQGIAPFIDYTNSNFSFIDNISIGLGSVHTQQSFTPISGVGIGIGGGIVTNPTYEASALDIFVGP